MPSIVILNMNANQACFTGQKMGFLTIGNVAERWVLDDITDNNPTYRIHDIS